MKSIQFVAINSKYSHTNLALLYLQKITPKKYTTHLNEFIISESVYDILAEIEANKPDVIAISAYIWNSTVVKELLADIKKVLPNSTIVLGGAEASYNYDDWFTQFPSIDYIIAGSGEKGWIHLAENDFSLPEKLIKIGNYPFNEIPFPYDDDIIEGLDNRLIYYEASRGCPFKCSFCLSSREDQKLEYREINKVKEELSFFIKHKVPLVKFIDRTFNANGDFAREIWRFLIDTPGDTKFHFEINPTLIDNIDIEILANAHHDLFQFEIGVQSTNSQTLKEIGREGNWTAIAKNINNLIQNTKIPIHLDLISGLPYESIEVSAQSFNDVYSLRPNYFQPGMLKVLPGTEMAEKAEVYQMTYQNSAPYTVLNNRWIRFSELHKLHNIEHLVNNLYNSGQFKNSLLFLEKLYGSPFDFYHRLERYWTENEIHFWLKDWVKTATYLSELILLEHPNQIDVFSDLLRYDLIIHTNLRYYPDFLLSEEIIELQQMWKRFLRIEKKRLDTVDGPNYNSLKNTLLYKPLLPLSVNHIGIEQGDCIAVYSSAGVKGVYQISINKILSVQEES
ncbi:MAG: DUF4080 domain-containing protein [Candidatus Cloacimonas sp.]|nr:B12-binding domain-containing radical SAM protein [Candidatus Cloacimonadota bacterium]